MAVQDKTSRQQLVSFVAVRQQQSSSLAKWRLTWKCVQTCVNELLHVERIEPVDIRLCLLNVYGDQTVDVSKVRPWMVRFSSGTGQAQLSAVLDFLEPGETINSDRYIATLTKLKARICGQVKGENNLSHATARPHTSFKTMEHTAHCKFSWTV
jgi:hypothetical protein